MIDAVLASPHGRVLDLATGTGDVLAGLTQRCGDDTFAVGMDMADGMLALAVPKLVGAGRAALVRANAAVLPCGDGTFDAITIAFGIRNVRDMDGAFREMFRVIRPGGRLFVLEFSLPERPPMRAAYLFYFRHVLPLVGGIISGNRGAYRYLNTSVEAFPHGEALCVRMRDAGFDRVDMRRLLFGVSTVYTAEKIGSAAV
jgi:demethylmenaquinone methyltransferase/2-methoxy-6-polyprenyl-1,4-benzoquinol methylase